MEVLFSLSLFFLLLEAEIIGRLGEILIDLLTKIVL